MTTAADCQPTLDSVQLDAIIQAEASIQTTTALLERYRADLPDSTARALLLRQTSDALCAAVRAKELLTTARDQYFDARYPAADAEGFFARR